jgi:CDP-diacylglycerol--glycerol-3-phosphate 3-phosphatidyltransferase
MNLSYQALLTWPNLLTCFRFIAAPILLGLAWFGNKDCFLILLACSFLTDALDGFVARLTHQVTELGAMLDSWADVIIYLTIVIGAWWLWPDLVKQEIIAVSFIVSSYLLPALVGIAKFGSFTSYHTWLVKVAAVCVAVAMYLLFLCELALPFEITAFICVLAALEECAITLILPEKRSNISSLWAVWRNLPPTFSD